MYVPDQFAEENPERLRLLIADFPLATLITATARKPQINHVPLLLDPEDGPHGALHGHVALANPLLQELPAPATAVFQGPVAYISPSWYASKAIHHRVVPTWNYAVVHVAGTLQAVRDRDWLHTQIDRLTGAQELRFEEPWAPGDAPADFLDKLLGSIVGIRLEVSEMVGKWKVSQNRSAGDRVGVAAGLRAIGMHQAAELIPVDP